MEKEQLKDRLQKAMHLRGDRAQDLVDRTGIPKNTMSYYLSGKTEPKADRLYKLAAVLDVNEAWLLGYDVQIQRSPAQKKNDQLVGLVARMKNEEAFFLAVEKLAALDSTQLETAAKLLGALQK